MKAWKTLPLLERSTGLWRILVPGGECTAKDAMDYWSFVEGQIKFMVDLIDGRHINASPAHLQLRPALVRLHAGNCLNTEIDPK